MLGKQIKHEFRATRRAMLPAMGVLLLLGLLANLSLRLIVSGVVSPLFSTLLSLLTILFLVLFLLAVIAAWTATLVIMVVRFYRSMFGREAYLTHSLPVGVHTLIGARLIVPAAWFLLCFAVLVLSLGLTVTNVLNLAAPEIGRLDLKALADALKSIGLDREALYSAALILLITVVGSLNGCLLFYAALSFGHTFSQNKALFCVLGLIGFRLIFQLLGTVVFTGLLGLDRTGAAIGALIRAGSAVGGILRLFNGVLLISLLSTLAESLILYFVTWFCLRKRLNLG